MSYRGGHSEYEIEEPHQSLDLQAQLQVVLYGKVLTMIDPVINHSAHSFNPARK